MAYVVRSRFGVSGEGSLRGRGKTDVEVVGVISTTYEDSQLSNSLKNGKK